MATYTLGWGQGTLPAKKAVRCLSQGPAPLQLAGYAPATQSGSNTCVCGTECAGPVPEGSGCEDHSPSHVFLPLKSLGSASSLVLSLVDSLGHRSGLPVGIFLLLSVLRGLGSSSPWVAPFSSTSSPRI